MRVSRLQVHGFKSFASPASLEFGAGITAVVGPNGSGKSNLVDAIRLVLGGASARELRGQRLEQVIFSGGEKRAAQGMAEVTIVFDNEDGRMPVEDVEVALTRRVYRDGTSEFRRNGQRVRLRDLGRLLDATGLAQAGYAVIAQNDIESIIRATPEQRRHLVEEAAGVRGAQVLIEDSRTRTEDLDRWLEGSVGRLAELLPRIEELRLQARTAEEAIGLREKLARLRGSLERAAWLAAVEEGRRLDQQTAAARRRQEEAAKEFATYEQQYLDQRRRLQQAQQDRLERERLLGQMALRVQQMEMAVERWTERAKQAAHDRGSAELQLREVGTDLAAIGGRAAADTQVEQEELARAQAEGEQLAVQLAEIATSTGRIQAEVARADADFRRVDSQAVEVSHQRTELEARTRVAQERVDEMTPIVEQLTASLVEARAHLLDVQAQSQVMAAEAQAADVELERAIASEAAALEVLRSAEEVMDRAIGAERDSAAKAAAQEAVLAERRRGRPIAEAASRGAVNLRQLSASVRPEVEADARAVEAALGQLETALVGDQSAALAALSSAGGVAEMVCWPVTTVGVPPETPPGCRPVVSALVGEPADLEVVSRLCWDVCLAATRQSAAAWTDGSPQRRAVLPDGTVIGTGFEITASEVDGDIQVARRLEGIQAELARHRVQVKESHDRVEWATAQHRSQRARVDEARAGGAQTAAQALQTTQSESRSREAVGEATQRLTRAEEELQRQRSRVEEGARRRSSLAERGSSLAEELEAVQAARLELAERLTKLAEPERNLRVAVERVRLARVELELREQARAQRFREEEESRARLLERGRTARRRVEVAENSAVVALALAAQSRSLLATTQEQLGRLADPDRQTSDVDPMQQLGVLERRRAELEAHLAHAAMLTKGLERDQLAQRDLVAQLRGQIGDVEEGADTTLGAVSDDPQRAAQDIARFERRLQQLGPVNELAPGQLQDLLDRTEGLRAAHEDTSAARIDIEAVRDRLDQIVDSRLRTTMKQVTAEFESTWKELFGGGRASLLTTGTASGSPWGVDLEVQPQGKRVIPMAMLSGGERALTALALILALQQVSPSPFYVFDEVDAALDEVNVGNFARLLSLRAERSQFLVVTHSLTTMAMASHLYGVTQDGRGASRLLSVRLSADGRSVEDAAGERVAEALVGS